MKLEFGSGDCPREGYEHCDMGSWEHVEYKIDVGKRLPFADSSIDEILARSILEHIPHGFKPGPYALGQIHIVNVLREWCRVLRPGASLHLIIPNIYGLVQAKKNETIDDEEFISYLYGGQSFPHNEHYCGFTPQIIERFLKKAGFSSVFITDPFKFDEVLKEDSWEMHVCAVK